jgi:hypothetical protein
MHIQPFIINNFQPCPFATSEVRKGPDQENVHNSGDTMQWILCFPDIVIIILTAADDLATDFVEELKNYFLAEKDDDTGAWIRSTLFQALFPEFLALKTQDQGTWR